MATKKTTSKKKAALPAKSKSDLIADLGVEQMVIGGEEIDVARGLTRSAAVDLASGASDLPTLRMHLLLLAVWLT